MKKLKNNKVAIVGKPNVGKSTLFNRLIGKRKAIVFDQPGVTRDRLYEDVEWSGKTINMIDTGGIETGEAEFSKMIRIQAEIAIEEAQQIIFVVDGRYELDENDLLIASILRKSNKKVYVVSNKLEQLDHFDYSVYQLGFENYYQISALHGLGIGEILDEIVANIEIDDEEDETDFKLAIIGKPNSGKSSLLNRLLKTERAIVSNVAGTTRDTIEERIYIDEKPYLLIDTAGILKKSKLVESVDHYALMRAMEALDNSDLAIVMIDANNQISHFDARLIGYANERRKPLIIAINKWDLVQKDQDTMRKYETAFREKYPFTSWMPFVFLSALKNQRIDKLLQMVSRVRGNMQRHIEQYLINELIVDMQVMQPAPSFNGGHLQIKHAIKTTNKLPTFIFFVNNIKYLHFSYQRYIENQIREYFDFTGTPINLIFKNAT